MSACFPYKVKSEEPYISANAVILAKLYNRDNPNLYVNVEMLFDTGAEVSLAPASLADALGLVLTDGEPVTLSGVGGTVKAYIHYIKASIGGANIDLPIAIATVENVPLLFGMYGPMNQYAQFILDNVRRELCLHTTQPVPELASKFPLIWQFLTRISEYLKRA